MAIDDGGRAFPRPASRNDGTMVYDALDGMSLRAYIATESLEIAHAACGIEGPLTTGEALDVAAQAVLLADALIAALKE
jgi:hypothetical protein